jgi:NAD(P)-dependent dehydrogenase (short-subunit alcohol dehydrogenase family)
MSARHDQYRQHHRDEYRSGVSAHWPFLSDVGRLVQKDLEIAEYTDPLHNPMIPDVKDVVGAVLYLAHAGQVTGEMLHVDGGAHAGRC